MGFKCSIKTCRESTQKTENIKMHGLVFILKLCSKYLSNTYL
jgi:hypothetical protein